MIISNGYRVTGGAIFLDRYTAPVTGAPVLVATPYSANVAEGNVLIVSVTGSNITNGTYYWRVDSNPEDFKEFAGSFAMSNNIGSFSVTPTLDLVTEGNEALNISIRSGTTTGPILTTANATIQDTTFELFQINGNVLQENQSLGFYIIGQNIPIGPTYWYTVEHITTTNADFNYGTEQGVFPIPAIGSNYTADGGITWSYYNNVLIAQSDDGFEPDEYFNVSLRLGSATGPILCASNTTGSMNTFTLRNVS
jgi:hypothetical protein